MCTWTAGLLGAVIGSAGVYLVFSCVVACATNTFVRVMVLTQWVYLRFESWLFLTEVKCFGFKFNDIIFRILF